MYRDLRLMQTAAKQVDVHTNGFYNIQSYLQHQDSTENDETTNDVTVVINYFANTVTKGK